MKAFLVLAFLTIAVTADKQQWESFKLTHSKQYNDPIEEKLRYEIFRNNLRKIQEHNAKYEKGESSYFMAVNQFADWTPEQLTAKMSTNYSSQPRVKTNLHKKAPNFVAPDRIDWREKGVVLEVLYQESCLGCWAFSAAAALEGQNALHNNVKQLLSKQHLIDCSFDYKNYGCQGGLPSSAFSFVKDHGICSEESYPYVARTTDCHNCSPVIPPIRGYKDIEKDEDSLRDAVAEVGPVSVAIDMAGWLFYGGGIFDDTSCSSYSVNHAVLLVGYQDNYWIIKNSFGKYWGENGYIRLIRGKNKCGIANEGSYPQL